MHSDYEDVKKQFSIIHGIADEYSKIEIPIYFTDSTPKDYFMDRKSMPYPTQRLANSFLNAFYFNPDDEVIFTLDKTNYDAGDTSFLKMPFDNMIINVDADFEGQYMTDARAENTEGELNEDSDMFMDADNTEESKFTLKTVFISRLMEYKQPEREGQEMVEGNSPDGQMMVLHALYYHHGLDKYATSVEVLGLESSDWDEPNSFKQFTHNIVNNFLIFLNQPEVDYRSRERSRKNMQKRVKKGKVPLPNDAKVQVSGEIKRYLDKVSDMDTDIEHSHRYWVRGHWRTLRDEEHWGDEAGKQVWVKPHIRGEGVLIEKDYELESKEGDN